MEVLWFCSELSELFTLPPGVDVWVGGCDDCCCCCCCCCGGGAPRLFSGSRSLAPFAVGICEACPWDEPIFLEAGGSALLCCCCCCCCLFFLPKRNDMATRWRRRRRYSGRAAPATHAFGLQSGGGSTCAWACDAGRARCLAAGGWRIIMLRVAGVPERGRGCQAETSRTRRRACLAGEGEGQSEGGGGRRARNRKGQRAAAAGEES